MEKKIFYRIGNYEDQKGLWYDLNGEYTGIVENEYTI